LLSEIKIKVYGSKNKRVMKKYYYLVPVFLIGLFVSCSGKYENAISAYIQSTEGGESKIDVKIQEVKELKKVTVGDSINYINMQSELLLKSQIDAAEKQLTKFQQDLVNIGTSSKVVADAYTVQLTKSQQTIDSLKAVRPEPTKVYEGKKTDEILAVITECKYTVNNKEAKDKTEAIKNFVMSPDGKVCYGTTDNPEMIGEK